jgi:hypothetical protein
LNALPVCFALHESRHGILSVPRIAPYSLAQPFTAHSQASARDEPASCTSLQEPALARAIAALARHQLKGVAEPEVGVEKTLGNAGRDILGSTAVVAAGGARDRIRAFAITAEAQAGRNGPSATIAVQAAIRCTALGRPYVGANPDFPAGGGRRVILTRADLRGAIGCRAGAARGVVG